MARQPHPAVPRLRVEVLGPLRLFVDDAEVPVPGPLRRAVLARLALAGGRSVSVEDLLDDIWSDQTPDSGKRALHSHISRLRVHLGPAGDRLERTANGYRLALTAGELDAAEVRLLAASARQLLGGDPADPVRAATVLRTAIDRWRGAPLEEFPDIRGLAAEAVQLTELRADLADDLLAARLAAAAGPADTGLASDGLRAAAAQPLRERTHRLAMEILARAGRQADAMRLAHEFRVRLAEETGFDPSPAFAALERSIAGGELTGGPGPIPLARPDAPLVGRAHELDSLRRLVHEQRLVTVVGPGGIGKTRLSLEVAAEIASAGEPGSGGRSVAVVKLAVIEDPAHLVEGLRAALGLRTPANEDVLAAAIGVLGAGRPVVVLDNCEHLADACRDLVAALLGACPDLTVLATSREPLGLAGEHVLRLGPLPVPGPGSGPADQLAAVPAVQAFTEYAARRCPGFAPSDDDLGLIGEIVRRLDGLPLALELAAGRVGVLSLVDLRDRLGRALDILSTPRATGELRHRTLRSTIEWSYRLLPEEERRLFAALSIFPGGVDLAAAEHMAAVLALKGDPAALLASLVDTSMVVADTSSAASGGPARYSMLETVRAFAAEQLTESGDRDAVEVGLTTWSAAVATAIGDTWLGPGEAEAGALLRRELANLRAAGDLARSRSLLDPLVTVTLRLARPSIFRGLPELWEWALDLATHPDLAAHPAQAEVLGAAAAAASHRGEFDRARTLAEQALTVGRSGQRFLALHARARVALARAEPERARQWWLESGADDPRALPTYRASAALAACYAGDPGEAAALLAESRAHADRLGAPGEIAFCEYVRGEISAAAGDPGTAYGAYESAIALAREAGAPFVEGISAVGKVSLLARTGRTAEALAGYGELLDRWRTAGNWTQLWATLRNLALLLARDGRSSGAALLLAAADAAPDAPSVSGPHAAELAAARRQLRGELGDASLRTLEDRARSLSRPEVLAAAFAAISGGPSAA